MLAQEELSYSFTPDVSFLFTRHYLIPKLQLHIFKIVIAKPIDLIPISELMRE